MHQRVCTSKDLEQHAGGGKHV